MKRLLVTLALLVFVSLTVASPVRIGIKSKGSAGQYKQCTDFIAGVNDLGSGTFGLLVTGSVVADLRDSESATTVLKLDATNVPAGLCSVDGAAATAASAACGSLSVLGLRPVTVGRSTLVGFYWECASVTNLNDPFWVFAECP